MRAERVGRPLAFVTLRELKANSRIDGDDEDLLLQSYLDAAHERAEQETGIVYGAGEWDIDLEPGGRRAVLPLWPINSVVSVEADGAVLDAADYALTQSGRTAWLSSGSWPAAIRVRVNAGMPMPSTVRQAVLLMASYWAMQRETASEKGAQDVPYGASTLLALNRRVFA